MLVDFVTYAVVPLGIWRLLKHDANDAFMNMAVDEAILEARIQEKTIDTLRLYRWKRPAVSIGRFQNVNHEVQLENCRRDGVDVVRRITGGGAVYHDNEGETTYSVVSSMESLGAADIADVYARIYSGLCSALRVLGVKADFNEGSRTVCPNLTVNGRKISGSAQCHKRRTVLQHGTILSGLDLERMFTCLRVSWTDNCMQAVNVARQKLTSLEIELGRIVSAEELNSALVEGFEKTLGMQSVEDELTTHEVEVAGNLRDTKYSMDDWNLESKRSEL
jgi:lipoate-protein ligase A